ncbi:pimeloyl-ACP methyl ester carboxylesterase [Rhodococcus sp. SMB37]|uniref:alpha/beta fold hydrolase n=1 Tax=Rhodococcus sp. SMB37 TaxID=2512213 RepID=UPI001044E4A6|nr:alpha/beta hydrolase [Rhodococcus sp. SMB37]TCN53623.1 pimeloyl-ACP methyl ester carboxylesterase [Rhodococcus sp. SMB37]
MSTGIVLVHGGQHTGRCWSRTVDEMKMLQPDLPVLAVDLPGRATNPADLAEVGIAECVASVLEDIHEAEFDDVVLVAHSMGGVTIPGVAAELGSERVRSMVFIAAAVPPNRWSILENLQGSLQGQVGERVTSRVTEPFPREMATELFCNGMTDEQTEFTLSELCAESSRLATERVDRSAMPQGVPRVWVLTGHDRAMPPAQQRRHIDNLGGVSEVVEIESCHDVMISEPAALARVVLECVEHYPAPSGKRDSQT